ncbi:uncharacterized protein STEHIDRAFT_156285 [Stereum hirsutum FP-91666 SS1]|uniref:uncharacterized protein n=1 Tax=Stereum hirsutum (strain FP-91666) TaxID=721885 RepID=UPI000440DAFF|nr:uncharacterized protein STEHIDRAFT_156285 [Stereum hirsutum FP-91666 SS1]EIM87304.1 hypothetical protein STEHIDRAFT_156285 [Stereum hirsutum FP-91666 SS1]
MAFIQDTVALGLIRDSYPQKIARTNSEPLEWSDMPREMYMPGDFDALFEWVKLQEIPHSTDPTRKFDVVHVPRPFSELSLRPPSLQRMTVRIFGVIGNLNLMDLGNWDRTEGGVPKAMKCGRNDSNLDSTRFSGSSETAY